MLQAKMFELRDSMTFIPVVAVLMAGTTIDERVKGRERYLLGRAGYGPDGPPLVVMFRADGKGDRAPYAPYDWGANDRSYRVAHEYIAQHWETLTSGDVVDVEYILGERNVPKRSERLTSS